MSAKFVHRIGIVVSFVVLFAWTSCLKREEFPVEPILTFKAVEQFHELQPQGVTPERFLNVIVDFTDGDGDIGLDPGDTLAPFGLGDAHYMNARHIFERLENGVWTGVASEDSSRIKRITPSGQDPTLNGEIKRKIGPYPGARPGLPVINTGDTMRVKMWLEDRALHRSNTVVSGPFILQ